MPKLFANGTYHKILIAEVSVPHRAPAYKLQRQYQCSPGGGQWWPLLSVHYNIHNGVHPTLRFCSNTVTKISHGNNRHLQKLDEIKAYTVVHA